MWLSFGTVWESTAFDPSVITTARDKERFAQPGCLILAAHLFDSGILLGGASFDFKKDEYRKEKGRGKN